jgi:hypothetical protein
MPKSIFDFSPINGSQNSLHFSMKLRIVIDMETSALLLEA